MKNRIRKKRNSMQFSRVMKEYNGAIKKYDKKYLKSLSHYYKIDFSLLVRELELVDKCRVHKVDITHTDNVGIVLSAVTLIACLYENDRSVNQIHIDRYEKIAYDLVFGKCQIQKLFQEVFYPN